MAGDVLYKVKAVKNYNNMGYTGLNHWIDSDNAADFVFLLDKAKTKKEKRKIIDGELKDYGNSYNTPGSVNIALAIEDGKLKLEDCTIAQVLRIRQLLKELKSKSTKKYKIDWEDEGNRLEHYNAYKRLLKVIS